MPLVSILCKFISRSPSHFSNLNVIMPSMSRISRCTLRISALYRKVETKLKGFVPSRICVRCKRKANGAEHESHLVAVTADGNESPAKRCLSYDSDTSEKEAAESARKSLLLRTSSRKAASLNAKSRHFWLSEENFVRALMEWVDEPLPNLELLQPGE